MNKSIIDSTLIALSKDKVASSLSASRDQWLKYLEKETLKKRNENINVKIDDDVERNIQKSAAERIDHKDFNAQLTAHTTDAEVRSNLKNIVNNSDNKINHVIRHNASQLSGSVMRSGIDEQNTQTLMQLGIQNEKTDIKVTRDHINTVLQKEQKYLDIKRPFTVTINENGIEVWLGDSSVCREQYKQILHRLKGALRDIGIKLAGLTINGEKVWDQQNTLEIKDELDKDNCINKIY